MLTVKKYLKNFPFVIIVFLIVFLYRLPNLGLDLINNDDGWWKSRGYEFTTALSTFDLEKTAPTYHPGVTLLWSQFAAIKTYGILFDLGYTPEYFGTTEYLLNHIIQNIFVVFFTSILLSILYVGLSKIIGKFYAVIFIIILISEPFFTALGRTIHLDAILAISVFTSFIYYYLALTKQKNIYMVIAGILAGLALLTKSPALFLIPMFLVPVIFSWWFSKKEFKTDLLIFLKTLSVMILVFFVLWPAMWVNPVEVLQRYVFEGIQGVGIEEGHKQLWFGKETSNPGVLFYPIVVIGRYSSFVMAGFIAGLIFLFKSRKNFDLKNHPHNIYIYSLIFFIAYLVMLIIPSKKIDRYSLTVLFPMIMLFLYAVMNLNLKRRVLKILLGMYIFTSVVIYAGIYPYYLTYYSPFIGGYNYGMQIIQPSWPIAYAEVAKYFNEKKDHDQLTVALFDHFYIRGYANFKTVDLGNIDEVMQADYLVLPASQPTLDLEFDRILNIKQEESIEIAGVVVYEIYKNIKVAEQP